MSNLGVNAAATNAASEYSRGNGKWVKGKLGGNMEDMLE